MSLGLEGAGMAATASGAIGGKLPRGFVRVSRVTGRAGRRTSVVARVLCGRMGKRNDRPVRIVMARGAIERCRHMAGDFARGGSAVVAALAVGGKSGVIEAGGAPRQSAVAGAAILCRRYMVAGHGCGANTRMTTAAGVRSIGSRPHRHVETAVLHTDGRERVGRMTSIAIVVAGDVAGVLPHRLHPIVATKTGASYLQVVHMDDG